MSSNGHGRTFDRATIEAANVLLIDRVQGSVIAAVLNGVPIAVLTELLSELLLELEAGIADAAA